MLAKRKSRHQYVAITVMQHVREGVKNVSDAC